MTKAAAQDRAPGYRASARSAAGARIVDRDDDGVHRHFGHRQIRASRMMIGIGTPSSQSRIAAAHDDLHQGMNAASNAHPAQYVPKSFPTCRKVSLSSRVAFTEERLVG